MTNQKAIVTVYAIFSLSFLYLIVACTSTPQQDDMIAMPTAMYEETNTVTNSQDKEYTSTPEVLETPTPGITPTPSPSFFAHITLSTNANIRSGPSTEYEIVGTAVQGEILDVYARTANGWLQISEDGKAWVWSSLGELDRDTSSIPDIDDLANEVTNELPDNMTPEFSDYRIDDVSFGNVKRYSLYVLAPFPIAIDEVKAICGGVVEEFKKEQPFNAVTVFVSDNELTAYGFTIASCTYAPNGEWSEADTVQTGNYANHEFSYFFRPKLDDPEDAINDRPTNDEIDICVDWDKTERELVESGVDVLDSEEQAHEIIATKYGLDVDTIYEINIKCVLWAIR